LKEQITTDVPEGARNGQAPQQGPDDDGIHAHPAVAIVVFITYEVMGQDIGQLVNNVDSALTTT
jgi:hypothetical protein